MADYNRYGHNSGGGGYAYGGAGYYAPPSAPPAPAPAAGTTTTTSSSYGGYPPSAYPPPPHQGFGFGFGFAPNPAPVVAFPPGTHPDVERAFRAADRDASGAIDDSELQAALSSAYHRFSIRTVRLLLFLFTNPDSAHSSSRMGGRHGVLHFYLWKWYCYILQSTNSGCCSSRVAGPAQFVSLWNCLGQWRGIFDRYDRDRSGKIDSRELTEALRSIGYAVPPSVIELLIANYNNGVPRNGALDFDNFVECGMIVKGLTEKFKEKDTRYTGSATLTYDGFLSMVIPFI
ncbi:hypothetical protein U9M48_037819, partial [Paspalum notatum var. saurae]